MLERLPRGCHGPVHVRRASQCHVGDRFLGRGIDGDERPSIDRVTPAIINQKLRVPHSGASRGRWRDKRGHGFSPAEKVRQKGSRSPPKSLVIRQIRPTRRFGRVPLLRVVSPFLGQPSLTEIKADFGFRQRRGRTGRFRPFYPGKVPKMSTERISRLRPTHATVFGPLKKDFQESRIAFGALVWDEASVRGKSSRHLVRHRSSITQMKKHAPPIDSAAPVAGEAANVVGRRGLAGRIRMGMAIGGGLFAAVMLASGVAIIATGDATGEAAEQVSLTPIVASRDVQVANFLWRIGPGGLSGAESGRRYRVALERLEIQASPLATLERSVAGQHTRPSEPFFADPVRGWPTNSRTTSAQCRGRASIPNWSRSSNGCMIRTESTPKVPACLN